MAPPRIQPNLKMLRRFLGHVRSWTDVRTSRFTFIFRPKMNPGIA